MPVRVVGDAGGDEVVVDDSGFIEADAGVLERPSHRTATDGLQQSVCLLPEFVRRYGVATLTIGRDPSRLLSAGRYGCMPTVSETYIENRQRVQPTHTNNYGSAHGGIVVKWMDEIGAMSAMRHAGETCVTARIDGLDFERPVPAGDTCVIESYAYAAGRTSVRVRLRAHRESPRSGEREQTTDSYFVFVAVDDSGSPTEVPDLRVGSDRCRRLREEALKNEPTG